MITVLGFNQERLLRVTCNCTAILQFTPQDAQARVAKRWHNGRYLQAGIDWFITCPVCKTQINVDLQ